mmetsp:Transcript_56094/g.169666  ORF Transcript_56094/g.169666 Transcript_56094/m.169666 type:complete len:104 (-) Transcript_56094:384-695(-)
MANRAPIHCPHRLTVMCENGEATLVLHAPKAHVPVLPCCEKQLLVWGEGNVQDACSVAEKGPTSTLIDMPEPSGFIGRPIKTISFVCRGGCSSMRVNNCTLTP